MAVTDYLRPVEHHTCGIPPLVMMSLRNFSLSAPKRLVDLARETYDNLCGRIEDCLSGRGVPVDKEELAAEIAAHLIIDAAYLHDRLRVAGALVGPFPYDYLADRIMPRKDKEIIQ